MSIIDSLLYMIHWISYLTNSRFEFEPNPIELYGVILHGLLVLPWMCFVYLYYKQMVMVSGLCNNSSMMQILGGIGIIFLVLPVDKQCASSLSTVLAY